MNLYKIKLSTDKLITFYTVFISCMKNTYIIKSSWSYKNVFFVGILVRM